jgi:PPP family 3-phenylpropionic acid transporter
MPPPLPLAPRLASFFFAYFAYAGIVMAYLPLYLSARGMSAGEIAFLVALPYIARTFAPAAWGWIADATGARRGIIIFSCAAAAVCFATIPHVAGVAGIGWLVAGLALLSAGAVPIVEALTLASLAGQIGRYGPIRVWGSVGFIVATFGGGIWLDHWPPETLPPLLVALSLVALAVALALPVAPRRVSRGGDAPRISGGVGALLAAGFCMSAAHGTLYTFLTLYLERAGHSGAAIGSLWTLGVLAEIVVFIALPVISAAIRCRPSCSRASPAPSCVSSPSAGCPRASGCWCRRSFCTPRLSAPFMPPRWPQCIVCFLNRRRREGRRFSPASLTARAVLPGR